MSSDSISISLLILLIHAQGFLSHVYWNVTCKNEDICALVTSEVLFECFYTHRSIQTVMWFSPRQKTKWRHENNPEDLLLDSDYAGRVNYTETTNSSTYLRIRDLRVTDSGEYGFMILTVDGEKYLSSITVKVRVTDLQVRTHTDFVEESGQDLNLTCSTACRLTSRWTSWFKNGKRVGIALYQTTEPFTISGDIGGSYSCSINDHGNMVHSPAICILENCFNVTYTKTRVCAIAGSSVEIPCTYSYPIDQRVKEKHWSYNQSDLRLLAQFAGRVEFVRGEEKNCTLRLNNVTERDSGEYQFLFTTDTSPRFFSNSVGVWLTVTGVQVQVSPVMSEERTAILSCSTRCTLPNNPAYIWYQNREIISNKLTKHNNLYLDLTSYDERDEHTCALRDESSKAKKASTGDCWWIQPAVCGAVGFIAALILSFLTATLLTRWKSGAEKTKDVEATASSPADTYTALMPTNLSSEYNTLTTYTGRLKESEREAYMQIANPSPITIQEEYTESVYENLDFTKFKI